MPQRTGVQVQPGGRRATSPRVRYAKGRVEAVADQIGMGIREMQIDGGIRIGSKELGHSRATRRARRLPRFLGRKLHLRNRRFSALLPASGASAC